MTNTEPTLIRLRRERDESKRQLDEVSSQRDALRLQRQRLIDATYYVESVLQIALGRGDLDGVRNAKARLAEIRQQRDDCFDMIGALSNRHQLLQGKYAEAFAQYRHVENEMEFLARRIPNLQRAVANARQREGEYRQYSNNDSPESLSVDLQKCESRYHALTGQPFSEQSPASAASA